MPHFTEARVSEIHRAVTLSDDEIEFMMAMERYMRLANRPFPTWHEVLRVAKELGYRKVDIPTKEPRPHSE